LYFGCCRWISHRLSGDLCVVCGWDLYCSLLSNINPFRFEKERPGLGGEGRKRSRKIRWELGWGGD
jgi:hypothetical protein